MKQKIISYILYGFVFSLFFIPLLTWNSFIDMYEFPKFVAFICITQCILYIFILKQIISHKSIHLKPLDIAVIIFGISMLAADLFGLDPKVSLLGNSFRHQGFITLFSGILLFFVIRNALIPKKVFAIALFSSTAIICLLAIFQGIQYFIFQTSQITLYQGRIVTTFGNPDFLGGYLACMFPLILFTPRSPFRNKLYGTILKTIVCYLIILAIWSTFSLSALLAVCLVSLGGIFYALKNSKQRALGMIFSIGIVGGIIVLLGKYFIRVSFWDNRIVIWKAALDAILKHPVLGVGQENFELIFPASLHFTVNNTHNIFVETAVSSGILGLGAFLSIIFFAWKYATLPKRLFLISFLFTAFFNPLSIPQIMLFWLILGTIRSDKTKTTE